MRLVPRTYYVAEVLSESYWEICTFCPVLKPIPEKVLKHSIIWLLLDMFTVNNKLYLSFCLPTDCIQNGPYLLHIIFNFFNKIGKLRLFSYLCSICYAVYEK